MPKIRDLGINVIPEITRPPEVGQGGGCGPTNQCYGCSAYTPINCGATVPCSAQYYGCRATPIDCGGGTLVQSQGCGIHPWGAQYQAPCGGGTLQNTAGCGDYYARPDCGGPTLQNSPGCQHNYADCGGATLNASSNCYQRGLTREAIAQLKQQLYKQIEQLEEYAKNIGPKTAEEIDAREKELKAELEELAKRRRDLGK
ncbi:MAG TPA: hypothetical protein VJ276_01470 [Thermoanaerobaculia bacterium]|nr:hypothetical protein [Thermoanaerobaculia bacterium]